MKARRHVEFVGGSGPAMLVGSGSAVAVRQGKEAAAACHCREAVAAPVTERRNSQAGTHLTGPATAPPRLAGNRAPRAEVDFVFLCEQRMW